MTNITRVPSYPKICRKGDTGMSLFNPIDILNHIIDEIVKDIKDYIENPETNGNCFTRKRVLDASTLIKFIIQMKGGTLDTELYNSFVKQGINISAPALVQRRRLLKAEIFQEILRRFNDTRPNEKLYKGYHIWAIDGSDFPLAPKKDSAYYMGSTKERYNGEISKAVSLLHGHFMYDVLNKQFIDCLTTPKKGEGCGERAAAVKMMYRNKSKKSVVIMDRGYIGFNTAEHCNRSGMKYIIRADSKFAKEELSELPDEPCFRRMKLFLSTKQTKENKAKKNFHWLNLAVTSWDFEDDYTLEFNVYKFKINEDGKDKWEILITNLFPWDFRIDEMKELYHMRWGIETAFNALKHAVGAINFHSYKDKYIEQEFYARLIFYNLAERIALNAVIQQKDTKYAYTVNFKMTCYILHDSYDARFTRKIDEICRLIEKYVRPIRPGRRDKRRMRPKSPVSFVYRVAA